MFEECRSSHRMGPTRMREAAVGLLYKGKRERPLSGTERRQLVLMAVATVLGVVAMLVGLLVVGPIGRNRFSPVLMQGGTLVVVSAGLLSMRHLHSARRRRFNAAVVAVLALLWLVSVVVYFSDR
jgi:hypothetical protein